MITLARIPHDSDSRWILTGSPAGGGVGMTAPQYLKDGDVVSCRITGLGHISNTIRVMHEFLPLDQSMRLAGAR